MELLTAALVAQAGEIEQLAGVPRCDPLQFADRPGVPVPAVRELHAWLYASERRIAYAVHAPAWDPPAVGPDSSAPQSRVNWDQLLHDHFHAHFRSGSGWSEIGAVAMPLRVPFDEPGLKIQPVLALWAPVSSGEHYLSETMTMSVRRGAPHVIGVQVFSGAMYERARPAAVTQDRPF